jgi:hypothetical protein
LTPLTFDDDSGDYTIVLHDHLAYRYEIISILGKGLYGQVAITYDYKTKAMMATKIICNNELFHLQGLIEVKVSKFHWGRGRKGERSGREKRKKRRE